MTPKREKRRHGGPVAVELRLLAQSISRLEEELRELRLYVVAQFEEHRKYHQANESRWGPARWCEQHPWRTAAAALVIGVTGAAAAGEAAGKIAVHLVAAWLGM